MEVCPLSLNFAKSRLDECDSMLYNDWLDIPMFVIPLIFCSKLGRVSDRNTQRNIFTLKLYAHFTRAAQQKGEHLCYGLNSACFRTLSLSLENPQDMNW
jgi:hypothetical protein